MAKFKLYSFWRSSAAHRVRIALALKGIEYEYHAVNLAQGEQNGAAYAARSATRLVPCLEVDGVPHVESTAILELLDALQPNPALFPDEPHAAARVRALVQIVNAGIQPLQNLRLLSRVSEEPSVQREWLRLLAFEERLLPRGFAVLECALERLRSAGVDGPFAHGSRVTAADLCIVPQVVAARRFNVDVAPYPLLHSVFAAASELEAFRVAAPERQPDAVPS